jgi:EmrB/QacA subfamily drug resistance transporter
MTHILPARIQPALTGRAGGGSPAVILTIIVVGQLMIILDASIIITALPHIRTGLHLPPASLSWVQNAYTLAFGGLLLLGARAGDILGVRRVFIAGISVFTLASLLGGLAENSAWLLTARAVQGAAAAAAAPSILSVLSASFAEGPPRTHAVALYSAVSGGGASAGLVLGGVLTDALSWRWGLFVNVPVGVALVLLASRSLPDTPGRPGRFDVIGGITATLGMTSLVYGFVRAASDGVANHGTVLAFALGIALLTALVANERRAAQPIMPLRLFASRERGGAYLGRLLYVSGMNAFFYFLTQYLQGVSHFSAALAGLAFLPTTAISFSLVHIAPKLVTRFGNTQLLVAGLTLSLAGMTWLSRITPQAAYFPHIVLPMILLGLGSGVVFIPLTSYGMTKVRHQDTGAAAGLVNVAHQLGGSLGLAALVTVFGAASQAGRSARGTLSPLQLAHGVAAALTGSAVFLALALVVAVTVFYPRQRRGENAHAE